LTRTEMLEEIKSSIDRLVALYEGQKQRADELEARLSASQASEKKYREQITELNGQIDNIKLSFAFGSTSDPEGARARITKLIAEIDKCIKLLEK